MDNKKKYILILTAFITIFGFPSIWAKAGDINANEQAVLNYLSQTFEYQGDTYVVNSSYYGLAKSKFMEDGVDLTSDDRATAISTISANIAEGVAQGYLVKVEPTKEPVQEEKPDNSKENQDPSDNQKEENNQQNPEKEEQTSGGKNQDSSKNNPDSNENNQNQIEDENNSSKNGQDLDNNINNAENPNTNITSGPAVPTQGLKEPLENGTKPVFNGEDGDKQDSQQDFVTGVGEDEISDRNEINSITVTPNTENGNSGDGENQIPDSASSKLENELVKVKYEPTVELSKGTVSNVKAVKIIVFVVFLLSFLIIILAVVHLFWSGKHSVKRKIRHGIRYLLIIGMTGIAVVVLLCAGLFAGFLEKKTMVRSLQEMNYYNKQYDKMIEMLENEQKIENASEIITWNKFYLSAEAYVTDILDVKTPNIYSFHEQYQEVYLKTIDIPELWDLRYYIEQLRGKLELYCLIGGVLLALMLYLLIRLHRYPYRAVKNLHSVFLATGIVIMLFYITMRLLQNSIIESVTENSKKLFEVYYRHGIDLFILMAILGIVGSIFCIFLGKQMKQKKKES